MTSNELKRLIRLIADDEDQVIIDRDQILFRVRGIERTIGVSEIAGEATVNDNGMKMPARNWVVESLFQIPYLATRILEQTKSKEVFVVPKASIHSRSIKENNNVDALEQLKTNIDNRETFVTKLIYLTADAGEGKSTLIKKLAHNQAESYINKETHWLLVPFELGGRTVLYIKDIISGILINKYRFPFHYNAFVELVQLGILVPALDGFEEMLVQSSRDDVDKSLISLLRDLDSKGTVVIAARKSHYRRELDRLTGAITRIHESDIEMLVAELNRWSRTQFLEYVRGREVENGETLYAKIRKLAAEDSILTRPVLVSHLVQMVREYENIDMLFHNLELNQMPAFEALTMSILDREANEKWRDVSEYGDGSLLSTEQHTRLLSYIAYELWLTQEESIPEDLLEYTIDLFASDENLKPHITRQIKDRTPDHALLQQLPEGKIKIQFDHQEFYHYFLSLSIVNQLERGDIDSVWNIISPSILPVFTKAVLLREGKWKEWSKTRLMEKLKEKLIKETRSSIVRQNMSLIMYLIAKNKDNSVILDGLIFDEPLLSGQSCSNTTFTSGYFYYLDWRNLYWQNVNLKNCKIDKLVADNTTKLENIEIDRETNITHVEYEGKQYYDPNEICQIMKNMGVKIEKEVEERQLEMIWEEDDEIKLLKKLIGSFNAANYANESYIYMEVGKQVRKFVKECIKELLHSGVLIEVSFQGKGNDTRYRLVMSKEEIDEIINKSKGNYVRAMKMIEERKEKRNEKR